MNDIPWLDRFLYQMSSLAWWVEAHPGFAMGLAAFLGLCLLIFGMAVGCMINRRREGLLSRMCTSVSKEMQRQKKNERHD